MAKTYTARITRGESCLVVDVPQIHCCTRATSLYEVGATVRDLIATNEHVPVDSFELKVVIDITDADAET